MNDSRSLSPEAICLVQDVHHCYGERVALVGVDLRVDPGQVVAVLGPNGSGKTTLFRLLSTLMPIQSGQIRIAGFDAAAQPILVRNQIGIVFQAPSLDLKLTVDENIACQAALYGIRGEFLKQRSDELLTRLRLTDRRSERCETLSGGLKRRVELAKGMLHQPRLLLLDEPSSGLDPSARLTLWEAIRCMSDEGVGVLLTTHLLEEADKADRVVIMNRGKVIAEGAPQQLREEMGQGVVTVVVQDAELAERLLVERLGLAPQRVHHQLRLHSPSPATLVPLLAETLGDQAHSISIGRPSLEDVFISKTGLEFVA